MGQVLKLWQVSVAVAVAVAVAAIDLITVTLWHLKLNLFPKKKTIEGGR